MDKRFRCKARSVKYTRRLNRARNRARDRAALIQQADLKSDFSGLRVAAANRCCAGCAPVIGLHLPLLYFHPFHDRERSIHRSSASLRSTDSNWLTDIVSAELANFKLADLPVEISPNLDRTWVIRRTRKFRSRCLAKESRMRRYVIDDTLQEETSLSSGGERKEKRNRWYRGFRIRFTFSNSIEAAHLDRSAEDFNMCLCVYMNNVICKRGYTCANITVNINSWAGNNIKYNFATRARIHLPRIPLSFNVKQKRSINN